jgi:hypothetical protein
MSGPSRNDACYKLTSQRLQNVQSLLDGGESIQAISAQVVRVADDAPQQESQGQIHISHGWTSLRSSIGNPYRQLRWTTKLGLKPWMILHVPVTARLQEISEGAIPSAGRDDDGDIAMTLEI